MSLVRDILRLLGVNSISRHEVRAEAWALGGRHQGEVLQGARSELKAPGLSARRAILLKAVIRAEAEAGA